jgi:predicted ATPase
VHGVEANQVVCDDMGKLVERKVIQKLPGRGPEMRAIKRQLSSESPKLAIIGPHGSGKTQLVNDIAVSFAQDEPVGGPGDSPFKTRLLKLNLDLLIAEEAHKEGWASTKLRAAKEEIMHASQQKGKDSQGVRFVIVVGMLRLLFLSSKTSS